MSSRCLQSYRERCQEFGVPQWVAVLLSIASQQKSNRERRRRAYRLICRILCRGGVGGQRYVTLVFPPPLKALLRCVFPGELCDYPDPTHPRVIHVTLADLLRMSLED